MGEIFSEKAKLLWSLSAVALFLSCGAEKRSTVAQVPAVTPAVRPLPLKPPVALPDHPPAPGPDAADVLVSQVEALYKSGMADYRSGNLEGAKEQFDQAVEKLLESKLDVQVDDRLSGEFDKLVEDVYAAEAAALERGDTLSPHNYVPSPLESFSGLTFPVDPRIKEQAQQEVKAVRSDLPLVSNDYVDGVLTYFQNRGRGYITTALKRLGIYQPIISDMLRKEGIPQDLIYLAALESAFNPYALSHSGAKGIWQFMLGTGMLYGLKKDRWVDEREDPVKSTQAAARHLKDLYQMFGDWSLAMAAYDSGPLTVQGAVEKTGYADYWTLRRLHALPTETEDYVPIFMATLMIAKDPKAYGFEVEPDPPLSADQVVVSTPTDLRLVAQLIDRPVEELTRLNPSLLRWTTPPNNPQFTLNIPKGTKEQFEQRVAAIPEDKRIWWRAHKVEEGETLSSIAKKLHVSPVALREVNRLDNQTALQQGTHLVVPLAPGKESSLARVREGGPRYAVRYRVRSGDTLEFIADRYDVTPYQIRRWNNLKTSQLTPGKPLRIYVAGGSRSASGKSHSKGRKNPAPVGKGTSPTKAASGTGKAVATPKATTGQLAEER
jgi:membrane-bound lytic murein transglycosylase D